MGLIQQTSALTNAGRKDNGRGESINNRQDICHYLCKALQATLEGKDIEAVTVGGQHVFITYKNGSIKPIRINGSSGTDLIKEILNKI